MLQEFTERNLRRLCKEICVSGVWYLFLLLSDSLRVGSELKRAGGERRAPSSRPLRSNGW